MCKQDSNRITISCTNLFAVPGLSSGPLDTAAAPSHSLEQYSHDWLSGRKEGRREGRRVSTNTCVSKRVVMGSQYCAQTCPLCQACLVGPWTLPLLLLALWSGTLTIDYKSGGKKGGRR